jgi:hypothetical protein
LDYKKYGDVEKEAVRQVPQDKEAWKFLVNKDIRTFPR